MTEPFPSPPKRASIADVLESAAASAGLEGAENRLGIARRRRVVVALVDGMGLSSLSAHAAHTPFLRSQADRRRPLASTFPSTTATALTSFGTGLRPGQHGITGYEMLAPEHPDGPRVVNQLGAWDARLDPREWQPHPSVFMRCDDDGLAAVTVSQDRFEGSGLTRAALGGGVFVAAKTSDERVAAAVKALREMKRGVVYVYWNEVDKAGHAHGVASDEYVAALEDVDFALKRLVAQAPEDTLVLVTADHGMIDVPAERRWDYSEHAALTRAFEFTAGEPRMVQLYWRAEVTEAEKAEALAAWAEYVGSLAWVVTRDEAIEAGWFGEVSPRVRPRIGDVLVAARAPLALYDGRRASAHAFEMVGQHGSVTGEEMGIPLFEIPAGGPRR
ncbi:alkaline phosphatase family protein [Falsarthrobacter nasiphocae]|uniref:Alkaline phosphatase family protein n=1 Tax=Falsarthrobacter nasiphocae TaxID=189863 RepID=A0AAE3YD93_9MICC|nr:alkaline phosphatase family protein [Falsarthrobacter nasiphocae]MDR6891269.1 hypothetical protein [Falsarthrobacter nasiphocae]